MTSFSLSISRRQNKNNTDSNLIIADKISASQPGVNILHFVKENFGSIFGPVKSDTVNNSLPKSCVVRAGGHHEFVTRFRV